MDTGITTIEHLLPSLEEIDFQLTQTVLGNREIESLAFSVSLEKISHPHISPKQKTHFSIKPEPIQCSLQLKPNTSAKKQIIHHRPKALTYRQKIKSKNLRITINEGTDRNLNTITKRTIADFPTASTFFHTSPKKLSKSTRKGDSKRSENAEKTTLLVGATKKKPKKTIFSIKQSDALKFMPYFQKNSTKRSQCIKSELKKYSIPLQVKGAQKKFSIRSKIKSKIH